MYVCMSGARRRYVSSDDDVTSVSLRSGLHLMGMYVCMTRTTTQDDDDDDDVCMYSFSLLISLWDDGIQFSTWRRANALAHDDGMFTSVDYT